MIKERLTIAPRQAKTSSVRRYAPNDLARILRRAIDDPCGDLTDSARLDMIGEEVGDRASRPGHRQSGENNPILRRHPAAVEPHVPPPGLTASRKRELVNVGAQIAEPVETCGGGMRDDRDIGIAKASPSGYLGGKLQPGGAKPKMIGLPRTPNAVDAVRHSLQPTVVGQARQRGIAHTRLLRLASGNQAPLALRNLR